MTGNTFTYVPASDKSKGKPGPAQTPTGENVWHGRTKEEVDTDNMKVAEKTGANDKRKVAPVGLSPDQYCSVLETDGSRSLRTFRDTQELTGEWKRDPQHEGAWMFVREEEKKN